MSGASISPADKLMTFESSVGIAISALDMSDSSTLVPYGPKDRVLADPSFSRLLKKSPSGIDTEIAV